MALNGLWENCEHVNSAFTFSSKSSDPIFPCEQRALNQMTSSEHFANLTHACNW